MKTLFLIIFKISFLQMTLWLFLLKELDKKNPIYLPLIRKAIYTYLNSSAGLENKKIYYKYSDMGNCSEKVLTMN